MSRREFLKLTGLTALALATGCKERKTETATKTSTETSTATVTAIVTETEMPTATQTATATEIPATATAVPTEKYQEDLELIYETLLSLGYGNDIELADLNGEVVGVSKYVIVKNYDGSLYRMEAENGVILRQAWGRWAAWEMNEKGMMQSFLPAIIGDYRGFWGKLTENDELEAESFAGQMRIMLSEDDGYWSDNTRQILDIAAENSWKFSFYLNTNYLRAESQTDVLIRIMNEGHELGYHTSNHKKFGWNSEEWLAADVADFENYIRQQTGKVDYSVLTMRPPYGYWDWNWLRFGARTGINTVLWNYYNEDPGDPKILIPKITESEPVAILLHSRPECVVWLEENKEMINELIAQGNKSITTRDLIIEKGRKI